MASGTGEAGASFDQPGHASTSKQSKYDKGTNMKKRWKPIAVIATAVVLVLAISGVVFAGGPPWKAGSNVGVRSIPATGSVSTSGTATTTVIPLSDAEKSALLFLREEEKLARDVYTALYARWGVPVFSNIATAESQHTASVKTLLDRYGLTDPVAVDTPGIFVDSELQAAYTQLVAQGNQSLEEALKAGVTIETLDIEDLRALITISAHNDVTQVAQNLLHGSQNHLAAFTRLLAN